MHALWLCFLHQSSIPHIGSNNKFSLNTVSLTACIDRKNRFDCDERWLRKLKILFNDRSNLMLSHSSIVGLKINAPSLSGTYEPHNIRFYGITKQNRWPRSPNETDICRVNSAWQSLFHETVLLLGDFFFSPYIPARWSSPTSPSRAKAQRLLHAKKLSAI